MQLTITAVHQDPAAPRHRVQDEVGGELERGLAEGGLVHQDVDQTPHLRRAHPRRGHHVRDAERGDHARVRRVLARAEVDPALQDHGGEPRDGPPQRLHVVCGVDLLEVGGEAVRVLAVGDGGGGGGVCRAGEALGGVVHGGLGGHGEGEGAGAVQQQGVGVQLQRLQAPQQHARLQTSSSHPQHGLPQRGPGQQSGQ